MLTVALFSSANAVVPSDVTFVNFVALYVGGAGAVTIEGLDGVAVTFAAVPAGTYLNVAGTRVKSTGTAGTSIVALN